MIIIRPIQIQDAEPFLTLGLRLDEQSHFMMLEPGERTASVEDTRKRIESVLSSSNQMIFAAEAASEATGDRQLAGFLGAYGGAYRRNYRTVYIVIGILDEFTGQGIGKQLFEHMEAWARGWGARRLELTVMVHNTRAIALYQKMGFEVEGTRRDSLLVDGSYVDELEMAKILS